MSPARGTTYEYTILLVHTTVVSINSPGRRVWVRSVIKDDLTLYLTLCFVALSFTILKTPVPVVVHDGRVLEKPADEDEVRRNIAGYAVSLFGRRYGPELPWGNDSSNSSSMRTRTIYRYSSILLLIWLSSGEVHLHRVLQGTYMLICSIMLVHILV